jgi:hypothetical protein
LSRFRVLFAWTLVHLVAANALALGEASSTAPSTAELDEARRHFELGIAHFDREEWQAALVEFLQSRKLAVTKANTKNAAICLRKVGRFDEALAMFQSLVRDFPDLPPADRELADREIAELQASVGAVEVRDAPPGAHVTIDGVERGATPLEAPVRLSAGAHLVRITSDGFLPYETRVDVVGRGIAIVSAKLVAVTQAGRVRVSERSRKPCELFVDGAVVGKTPWEGALAPGPHSVWLVCDGSHGTSPAVVTARLERVTTLELTALPLRATLEVEAEPPSAEIFVDGARVGRGTFKGRLPEGEHPVIVSLGGYETFERTLTLESESREVVRASLEPLARGKAGVALELGVGMPITLLWGGSIASTCTANCSSPFRPGVEGILHASYRLPSGVGFGAQVGYARLRAAFENRKDTFWPVGRARSTVAVDDELRISGLLVGAEAEYSTGARFRLKARLAVGALLGAVTDHRTGTFTDSMGDHPMDATATPSARYLYVGPELRAGHAIGDRFEVNFGTKLLLLAALSAPTWDVKHTVRVGNEVGTFPKPDFTLTGGVVMALVPEVALAYAF